MHKWNKDKENKFWAWYDLMFGTIGITFCTLWLILTNNIEMLIPLSIVLIFTLINIYNWRKVAEKKFVEYL